MVNELNNVVQISEARAKAELRKKIDGLERSISEKKEILNIREDYLNKLSRFQKYDTIRIECHELDRSVFDLSITIGVMESKLIKLNKELTDE